LKSKNVKKIIIMAPNDNSSWSTPASILGLGGLLLSIVVFAWNASSDPDAARADTISIRLEQLQKEISFLEADISESKER
jgi:hypothetical protein